MPLAVNRTSPTTLTITRGFKASPQRVFRAHVEPALIQRWCYGFEGWRMPVCINDARPGGELRWEWANDEGAGFHVTGTYDAVEPPQDGRAGASSMSSGCTCPTPRPTTTSRRPSPQRGAARSSPWSCGWTRPRPWRR
jgi:hypothetical protein